ncbi:MAG TPA: hypothetical protein P5063_03420, partial [Methanomassiliicoccales archaeon]|nr:hypothetical protein [Methanomassiliicoccales archaeon]
MTKGKDRSVPRAEQGNAEQVSLTADQAEVERLSKWLDGEGQGSALLTWLGEGGDVASEDELAELKERVGRYEMELAAVRALLAVDGKEGEGTAQRLQALIQERDALKEVASKAVAPNGGNGLAENREKEL